MLSAERSWRGKRRLWTGNERVITGDGTSMAGPWLSWPGHGAGLAGLPELALTSHMCDKSAVSCFWLGSELDREYYHVAENRRKTGGK